MELTGQILHPDHLDSYAVKGYITGIAKVTFCIL
jgi:hypothetical protein